MSHCPSASTGPSACGPRQTRGAQHSIITRHDPRSIESLQRRASRLGFSYPERKDQVGGRSTHWWSEPPLVGSRAAVLGPWIPTVHVRMTIAADGAGGPARVERRSLHRCHSARAGRGRAVPAKAYTPGLAVSVGRSLAPLGHTDPAVPTEPGRRDRRRLLGNPPATRAQPARGAAAEGAAETGRARGRRARGQDPSAHGRSSIEGWPCKAYKASRVD